MELASQKFRANAPELDPLRIGTGWKEEDLGKVQIFIESTFGDSHPGSGHLDKVWQLLVDLVQDILQQICVTVRVREMTESTTPWSAVR